METEVGIKFQFILYFWVTAIELSTINLSSISFHYTMCFILIEEMTGVEDTMIVEGMTGIEIEGMTDVILTKDLDQDMVVLIYDLK